MEYRVKVCEMSPSYRETPKELIITIASDITIASETASSLQAWAPSCWVVAASVRVNVANGAIKEARRRAAFHQLYCTGAFIYSNENYLRKLVS